MSELEVKIPFVDIIEIIMTLEKNEHHKEANLIVRDIVRDYSGDYNMLEKDIDKIFNKGLIDKDIKILKKLFGGLIWD